MVIFKYRCAFFALGLLLAFSLLLSAADHEQRTQKKIAIHTLHLPVTCYSGEHLEVQGNFSVAGSVQLSHSEVRGEASVFGCFFAKNSVFKDIIVYAASYDRTSRDVQKILANMESSVDVMLTNCNVTGEFNVIAAQKVLLINTSLTSLYFKPKVGSAASEEQILEIRGNGSRVGGTIVFEQGTGKVIVPKGFKIDPSQVVGGLVVFV